MGNTCIETCRYQNEELAHTRTLINHVVSTIRCFDCARFSHTLLLRSLFVFNFFEAHEYIENAWHSHKMRLQTFCGAEIRIKLEINGICVDIINNHSKFLKAKHLLLEFHAGPIWTVWLAWLKVPIYAKRFSLNFGTIFVLSSILREKSKKNFVRTNIEQFVRTSAFVRIYKKVACFWKQAYLKQSWTRSFTKVSYTYYVILCMITLSGAKQSNM